LRVFVFEEMTDSVMDFVMCKRSSKHAFIRL
jgi:hypothetical protein